MTAASSLVLRDIHQPPAPGWWPPAPGWWGLAALLLVALAALACWLWWRRRRRRALARTFDIAVDRAASAAARVAAISQLLRRAARQRDPAAATLQGEAWLRFLDAGMRSPVFASRFGPLLLEGGFRGDDGIDPAQVAALREAARARFLQWTVQERR